MWAAFDPATPRRGSYVVALDPSPSVSMLAVKLLRSTFITETSNISGHIPLGPIAS